MKKTLFIAVVAMVSLASCSKDRTCTCTSTTSSMTVNGVTQTVDPTPTTTVTKLTKVSKGSANCNSGDETITANYTSGGSTFNVVQVTKNDCKLD